ncbi:hypothetical protein D3C85_1415160 [compost metagenome]
MLQDQTGDNRAEHAGDGQGHDEHRSHHPSAMAGEPGGEVEDNAGKESRLGDTDQQPQRVEGQRRLDEHHCRRQKTPADHDPGNPATSAEAVQGDVAGNFEDQITEEEYPRAQAINGFTEFQVIEHL